jgi:hypothetical protein
MFATNRAWAIRPGGVRYTAQAFQQMRPARRRVVLLATLRELEATLTDAAIDMFIALVGRAHLRARKRLEQRVAVSGREGRERMLRIARVLEAISQAARAGGDVAAAVDAVASLDIIDADAAIIRRTASPHRNEVLDEIAAEYRAFKRMGPFRARFDFQGRAGMQPLRDAMAILADLDGDWRRALPDDVPLGHVEHRWRRHVMTAGGIDRTHWEMATYSALSNALASVVSGCRPRACIARSVCCLPHRPARAEARFLARRSARLARREGGKAR